MGAGSARNPFERRNARFEQVFSIAGSAVCAAGAVAVGILAVTIDVGAATVWSSAAVGVLAAATLATSLTGRYRAANTIMIIGGNVLTGAAIVLGHDFRPIGALTFIFFHTLSTFLLSARITYALMGLSILSVVLAGMHDQSTIFETGGSIELAITALVGILCIDSVTILFARNAAHNLADHRRRLQHDEALFERVPATAGRLGASARQFLATSREQREGVERQSTAVAETHASLTSVLGSSEEIVKASTQTLAAVSSTLENAERASENITRLATTSQRIDEILGTIRELARKSDILALNASLQGTKAGEAGRGFALIAKEMQRLAEHTAQAVADIRELTTSIHEATAITRDSIEETTRLAKRSTEASREIDLYIQMQREGVARVMAAMDDITEIGARVAVGNEQTAASADDLKALAESLGAMVVEFKAAAET